MRPYRGAEDINPNNYLRVGVVREVLSDVATLKDSDNPKTKNLGRVRVEWLDWPNSEPAQCKVPVMYPSCSNHGLKKDNLGTPTVGVASGIFYMPAVGDIVVCGFRLGGFPVVLGCLPRDLYKSTSDERESGRGKIQLLKSGEFDIKSKQQAEVFLTEKGTIRLLVKEQPSDDTTAPINALAEIIIGKSYVDENYSDTNKSSSANGVKDIVCHIKMESGAGIKIDSVGNIEIDPASGKSVNIGSGNKGAARDGDSISINIAPGTFGVEAVPGTPIPVAPTTITGTITQGSTKVKIG